MPGVVLVNPRSGPDETSTADIAAGFPGSRVEEIDGKAVRRQVEAAVAVGEPSFLAVAGGDGTIRCAAGVVAGTELPLLPIPAGTRNHFAREVGIDSLDAAFRAPEGRTVEVDVGEVNGEVFVNNANVGAYPRIVRDRDVHEKRFSKRTATLVAAWAQVRDLRKFDIVVDGGPPQRAWMVFIGNGLYGTSIFDVATREALDAGILDVRILRADGRLARLRVAVALLAGRIHSSRMTVIDQASSVTLGFPGRSKVDVALDGEVLPLETPLRFRCRARALKVLVPPADAATDG